MPTFPDAEPSSALASRHDTSTAMDTPPTDMYVHAIGLAFQPEVAAFATDGTSATNKLATTTTIPARLLLFFISINFPLRRI